MGEKNGIVEVTSRRMAFDLCVVSFRRRQKRLKPFLELWWLRVILELRFASKPSKFCVGERSERSKTAAGGIY